MSKILEHKQMVQQAIWFFLKENPFAGALLQELNIGLSDQIPTAALVYNKKDNKFQVWINGEFFSKLSVDERVGVFHHEILHFTHGHILRFEHIGTKDDMQKKNIAMDMAINQLIKTLPKGCVNVKDWKGTDGLPFPEYQSAETYFQLIQDTTNKPQDAQGEQNAKDEKGPEANWGKCQEYKEFDQHDWEQLSEEEKQRMLKEAKKAVTRAVDKTFKDYTKMPDAIRDLLQSIETNINKLNYKALLRMAIKKTLSTQNRTGTWYRPNKRYGVYAPGTTDEKAPFLNIYIDTSGSISHTELNEFMQVMDGFLKNSAKKCNLGLWHTALYDVSKYKLNQQFEDKVEAGGTDPTCVVEHINKTKPNLSIILTDGHYEKSSVQLGQKAIWVISKNGTTDHPHKTDGVTVKMS